jgi:hypothetical protein
VALEHGGEIMVLPAVDRSARVDVADVEKLKPRISGIPGVALSRSDQNVPGYEMGELHVP